MWNLPFPWAWFLCGSPPPGLNTLLLQIDWADWARPLHTELTQPQGPTPPAQNIRLCALMWLWIKACDWYCNNVTVTGIWNCDCGLGPPHPHRIYTAPGTNTSSPKHPALSACDYYIQQAMIQAPPHPYFHTSPPNNHKRSTPHMTISYHSPTFGPRDPTCHTFYILLTLDLKRHTDSYHSINQTKVFAELRNTTCQRLGPQHRTRLFMLHGHA